MRTLFFNATKVVLCCLLSLLMTRQTAQAQQSDASVTFASLLQEMNDRAELARLPAIPYQSLQASSYNRLSTHRDQPDQGTGGWFADSDGLGFIRTEEINGQTEWVIMEHDGPGCITRLWTPFFYYNFNERTGPNIRIYLDGSDEPVIDTPLIDLVTEKSFVTAPFSTFTARGGVCYLPIPYAKSCIITVTSKSFYNIVNYRAYPQDTTVQTFTRDLYDQSWQALDATGRSLLAPTGVPGRLHKAEGKLGKDDSVAVALDGAGAVRELVIELDAEQIAAHPELLRTLVLSATFDGEETVWCPVGDFFGSANKINALSTWTRTVDADGTLTCRWVMPYEASAELAVTNLGDVACDVKLSVRAGRWDWDDRSMYFHANWRSDDILPGTPFVDWNFVDIRGQGVFVGDQWTVLNPDRGWWGEGDEKIYVDDAWDAGFPTHFGTGTEDYYGWAGGVNPTKDDSFSIPYGSNSVGSTAENNSRGFNVCARIRALDAIPFDERLVFDMEASPGTQIRNPWNLLGYSSVVYWYARPGSTHNRPKLPEEAVKPIMSLEQIEAMQEQVREAQ